MANVLVTGASGFIGHVLAGHLRARGLNVTTLVRSPGHDRGDGEIPIRSGFDDPELADALSGRRIEVVYHLAAAGVRPDDRDPDTVSRANVLGTASVAALAARIGAKGVVYTGSCSEYSPARHGHAVTEDHPILATDLYGASKAAGGLMGRACAAQAGLGFVWMRLFGTYGPNEAAYRLIPHLVSHLIRNEEVDLTPGEQIRDFLHVGDVAAGLASAGAMAAQGDMGIYNLCSGRPASVREVAELVADALDRPRSLLKFGARPYRVGELMWLVGDNAHFRTASGWTQGLSLEDGVTRTALQLATARGA